MNLQFFSPLLFHRSTFAALVMVVTVISTASSFVKPTANAYVLNCFSIHLFYILAIEIKWYENVGLFRREVHFFFHGHFHMNCVCVALFYSCTDQKALRLAKLSVALWVLAISCWVSDRFGCSLWQRLNFSYLHALW